MVDAAGAGLYGPGYIGAGDRGEHLVQASSYGGGVAAELEKLRGLPVFQLLSSGQEAADKLPAGKGIQHGVIGMDIAGGELVQDSHHINVAGFCGLLAAVAPLESGKPDAVRKGLIQGSHIFFNKFSYFNHFR